MFRVPLAMEQLPVWDCIGAVKRVSRFSVNLSSQDLLANGIEMLGKKIGETQTKRKHL